MSGREKNEMTTIKDVKVEKEEGLSYVAVQSAPRKRMDMLLVFQQLLIGAAGASVLMGIGAYMALTVLR